MLRDVTSTHDGGGGFRSQRGRDLSIYSARRVGIGVRRIRGIGKVSGSGTSTQLWHECCFTFCYSFGYILLSLFHQGFLFMCILFHFFAQTSGLVRVPSCACQASKCFVISSNTFLNTICLIQGQNVTQFLSSKI